MCIKDTINCCYATRINCANCLNKVIKDILGLDENEMYAFDASVLTEEIPAVIELINDNSTKMQIRFKTDEYNIKFTVTRRTNGNNRFMGEYEVFLLAEILKYLNQNGFIIVNL